jgi:hypothetical protein
VSYEVTEAADVPAGVVPVKPQTARLLKVFCRGCGYTARITQRWITKAGTPDCPTCHEPMVVDVKAEKDAPVDAPPVMKTKPPKAKPVPVVEPEYTYEPDFTPLDLDGIEPVVYSPDEDEPIADPAPAEAFESVIAKLLAEL